MLERVSYPHVFVLFYDSQPSPAAKLCLAGYVRSKSIVDEPTMYRIIA